MMQAIPDHDFLGVLESFPDPERNGAIAAIHGKGDGSLNKVMLEVLLAIGDATPENSQGEPELPPRTCSDSCHSTI